MELCLATGDEPVASLWVRIREETCTGDAAVGICYIPSDKEEGAGEAFFRQLEKISVTDSSTSVTLITLLEGQRGWAKLIQEILERIEDNFLMHMTDELVREGALLDL